VQPDHGSVTGIGIDVDSFERHVLTAAPRCGTSVWS
jgi:hypothetical protein